MPTPFRLSRWCKRASCMKVAGVSFRRSRVECSFDLSVRSFVLHPLSVVRPPFGRDRTNPAVPWALAGPRQKEERLPWAGCHRWAAVPQAGELRPPFPSEGSEPPGEAGFRALVAWKPKVAKAAWAAPVERRARVARAARAEPPALRLPAARSAMVCAWTRKPTTTIAAGAEFHARRSHRPRLDVRQADVSSRSRRDRQAPPVLHSTLQTCTGRIRANGTRHTSWSL